ncbi:hypothetical protein WMF31_00545 [Sorangium sp. So ce1036]|uniref:hypothetical protein n=1 Tax=Sorangium sp. So ce1036 TaxID=3133328 RepID=UPI003F016DE2
MALKIALAHAAQLGLGEANDIDLDELEPRIADLLRLHHAGGQVSEASLKTYESRLRRLFHDFYNATKSSPLPEEAPKKAAEVVRPADTAWQFKIKREMPSKQSPAEEAAFNFGLPGGRRFYVRLPARMSKSDIEVMWKQLDALRTLLETMAEAEEGKTD